MASKLLEYPPQSWVRKTRNLPQLNLRSSVLLGKDENEGSHGFWQIYQESLLLTMYFQIVTVFTARKQES